MTLAAWYLVAEILLASVAVLGTHALRRRTSLVYSYAAVAFMAFASWAAPHHAAISLGPLSFYVESSVFFASGLLGVFVLYVADGPRAGRMGLFVMLGTALMYTLTSLMLHRQFAAIQPIPHWVFPSASLRAGAASMSATLADLVALGLLWETFQRRVPGAPLVLRVFATLCVVLLLDSVLYVTLAWAGSSDFLGMLSGSLTSRIALAAFYAPIVAAYLHYEMRAHGLKLAPRPVLSIVSKEDLERELLSARHGLRIGAEALWASEERYRRMVDDIPSMVFRFSSDGRLTYANRALCLYLDRSAESLLGTSVLTPIDKAERTETWNRVMQLTPTHPVVELTVVAFPRPGVRRTQRWIVRGVFSPSGGGLAFQAVGEDVTDQRRSELALLRLRAAIDQVSECVGIADAEGCIQFANPALARALDRKPEELLGTAARSVFEGRFAGSSIEPLLDGVTRSGRWSGRLQLAAPDAGRLDYRVTVAPIVGPDGDVDGHAAIAHDVSREERLEEQMRQVQRMESLGHLAAGVAHDFNNLLTVIWHSTEMASDALSAGEPDSGEAVLQALRDIRQSADSAAELTRQLTSLGRKERVSPEPVDVASLVERLAPMLNRLARGVRLVLDLQATPRVLIDPLQLERVLINLVVNARDATPPEGTVTISTSSGDGPESEADGQVADRDHAVLTVSDTGSGMDETTRKRAFEPFFTTKAEGRGTGLGLSAVYGIVQQAGGSLRVHSELGRGSRFSVYLPVPSRGASTQSGSNPGAREDGEQDAAPASRALRGEGTILLCEPDEQTGEGTLQLLEQAGYRVHWSREAAGALEQSTRADSPVDLVVVDVLSADLTGIDLVSRVREHHPDAKAVLLSGRATAVEASADPGIYHLPKPHSHREMLQAVARALSSARA